MNVNTINSWLLEAFRVLNRNATVDTIRGACRHLIRGSDLYNCGAPRFSDNELNSMADAVFWFLTSASVNDVAYTYASREIRFEQPHALVGNSIEYHDFASMISEELLFLNYSEKVESLSAENQLPAIEAFAAAICFRYKFCVLSEKHVFPVSKVLDYVTATGLLSSELKSATRKWKTLETTMYALQSLERS